MNSVSWIVLVVAMFGVGWFSVRWLIRRGVAEYRHDAEKLEKIASLSVDTAAYSALPVLSDDSLFRCVQSPVADDGSLEALASELRRIFETYDSIQPLTGSHAIVARSFIGSSAVRQDFIRIGSVAAGTDVEGELGVRPGDETIYELYFNEAPDPTFGMYKSIYHWILAMAEEARADLRLPNANRAGRSMDS